MSAETPQSRLVHLFEPELQAWGERTLEGARREDEDYALRRRNLARALLEEPSLLLELVSAAEGEGSTLGELRAVARSMTVTFLDSLRHLNQFFVASSELEGKLEVMLTKLLMDSATALRTATDTEETLSARLGMAAEQARLHIVQSRGAALNRVISGRYAPQLQWAALGLSPDSLKGPVLDLGCGEDAFLVRGLRDLGIEAYGIDRRAPQDVGLSGDWLTWDYGRDRWGTVISHLGFSLHFLHHHLGSEEQAARYAHAYLRIVRALVPGGTFAYVPSLPFFETHLPEGLCQLTHHPLPEELRLRLSALPLDAAELGLDRATHLQRRR